MSSAVTLKPTPGFCIKSTALQPGVYTPASKPGPSSTSLEPQTGPIRVPLGIKVFVNIAWDANVPPPPEGSEDAIQKVMSGEGELDEGALATGRGWFVPVVVSEPRSDADKGE